MIKNYLVVAIRNLVKNRLFTFINILGLGIGLSVCIVAYFNHMFNYDFDRTHENFASIYRINSYRDMQGREQEYGIVPATLGLEIKKDIPGIDYAARLLRSGSPVKYGENIFPSQISYVDPEFLKIFTFPMIMGNHESLEQHGNVLLSRKMATTLFGNEYPVGKSISIINDNQKEFTYTVSGVFEDLPDNSSFRIDILTHFDNFLLMWQINDADWKQWVNALFIQVNNKSLLPSITESLKDYLPVQNRAREDFKINRFTLIPLKDVGKNSRVIWSSGLFPSLHPAAVVAPPVMAIFILLIACFNFANTSIATFSKRLKEIGLRKTFGGQRSQLVTQFMIETLIVCFLALFVGVLIAEFLVPAYSNLWSYMTLKLTFTGNGFFWIFLVILVLVTGFTAGVYPAIYVSSYNPASVLQGTSTFRGSGRLSAILLTLQFSISVMALIMGLVFARNSEYQNSLDMGYDKDQLLVLPIAPENYNSLRTEILANPKVISAAGTQNHIGFGSYRRPVKDADKQLEVDVMDIGPEYASTMGLRLVEGRLFDRVREAADRENNSIVVNQKLLEDFGWDEGTGKVLTLYDTTRLNIIGVVKDFYIGGLWQEVEPAILRLVRNENYYVIVVRASHSDLPGILESMESTWKSMVPNSIFGGRPQEELMEEAKDINNSILKVNVFLAIVATILSLIGMFNLVSLDIIRRTKEVGIRKIQGAPVPNIMFLISKKFIYILGFASLLGCLGGYYLSYQLLDSIWDYFVKIRAGLLVTAVLILFIATLLTLSVKIAKAARRNPAVSLRYQ